MRTSIDDPTMPLENGNRVKLWFSLTLRIYQLETVGWLHSRNDSIQRPWRKFTLGNSRVIGEGAFIRDRALSCSQHVHLSMRLDIASVGIGTVRESKYLLFFIKKFSITFR